MPKADALRDSFANRRFPVTLCLGHDCRHRRIWNVQDWESIEKQLICRTIGNFALFECKVEMGKSKYNLQWVQDIPTMDEPRPY